MSVQSSEKVVGTRKRKSPPESKPSQPVIFEPLQQKRKEKRASKQFRPPTPVRELLAPEHEKKEKIAKALEDCIRSMKKRARSSKDKVKVVKKNQENDEISMVTKFIKAEPEDELFTIMEIEQESFNS